MKDMHSNIEVRHVFGPVVMTADNTPAAIDRQGYESAELVIGVGIGGITFDATDKVEFTLTHSDDDSTYANVADVDMLGVSSITGGIIKSLIAAHAAAAKYRFGYVGNKRYLKLLANFSGTHVTGTPISVEWIFGNPSVAPIADAA